MTGKPYSCKLPKQIQYKGWPSLCQPLEVMPHFYSMTQLTVRIHGWNVIAFATIFTNHDSCWTLLWSSLWWLLQERVGSNATSRLPFLFPLIWGPTVKSQDIANWPSIIYKNLWYLPSALTKSHKVQTWKCPLHVNQ